MFRYLETCAVCTLTHPRSALVEAVHDSRPLRRVILPACALLDAVRERVHQRAVPVAGGRVHDHAGCFVDGNQVLTRW